MKIGMTSLTLSQESITNVVRYANEAGLTGIEWGVSDNHMRLCDSRRAKEIRELSLENDIEIISLGSYCRMETKEECDWALETAVLLGAPIIRIWAGRKSPCDCEDDYRNNIITNTVYMAEQAAKYDIRLGFEYHQKTLTEGSDEALVLVQSVNRDNVGLYWQLVSTISPEENVRDRNKILPYCVGNIHVQNYKQGRYYLLSEMEEQLQLYFADIKNKDYQLMIEFVKDCSPENLKADASTLRRVIQ